jgi:hypothetical protein
MTSLEFQRLNAVLIVESIVIDNTAYDINAAAVLSDGTVVVPQEL